MSKSEQQTGPQTLCQLCISEQVRETTRAYARLWDVPDIDRAVASFLDVPRANEALGWLEIMLASELTPDICVLEIGSGMGTFTAVAQKGGGRCFAIDPVSEAIYGTNGLAKCNTLPQLASVAREEWLPFPSESFDAVVSIMALGHSQSPRQVLLESLRVACPGATIMHVLPNHNFPFEFHFDVPWLASLLPKTWAKAILPTLTQRDRKYVSKLVDELHWEITPGLLGKYLSDTDCQILSCGHEFWGKRLRTGILVNHHTKRFAGVLKVIQRLRLAGIVNRITIALGFFIPLFL